MGRRGGEKGLVQRTRGKVQRVFQVNLQFTKKKKRLEISMTKC